MLKRITLITCAALLSLSAQQAAAKVTAAEAAKLGQELTPIGAEKAGNKDGSIPEWKGGNPKKDYAPGEFPNDPSLDGEKPLYTITKANMAQYKDFLTEGHKKLLSSYDSYKMNVYPTHRVAAYPDFIYKATAENALTAELVGTDVATGAKLGFPFPIPKSAAEVIWNHKLKWRGNAVKRYNNQLIVQPSGDFQLTKIVEDVKFYYANSENPQPLTKDNQMFLKYLSQTIAPPRMAGTFILVHEKGGLGEAGRAAWLYSPALKRIRRAPTVQYDNPYEGTDGNQFYDQVDIYNGALDRYDWKLVGKKEMILPYNAYKIGSNKVKFKDMVKPKHINQDLARYEKHRYWVIEGTVKAGTNHTFKKRVMYSDEDSWSLQAVDCYDKQGQLYKFQEGHMIYATNIQTSSSVPELIYDFTSGRYFVTAAANEDKPNDFSVNYGDDFFEASVVQKRTTK